MTCERLVLAVDGSNWVHRAHHTPSTRPHRGASIFCDMLAKVDRQFGPSHLFVAFDHPAPTWRHELFAGYKAERPPKESGLIEDLDLSAKAAAAYGCQVFCLAGWEGDDLLGTISCRAAEAGIPCIIASSDKDMAQLCCDEVRLLDPKYDVIGPAEIEARWGVAPPRLVDVFALMGDSTDGIPGVDGIGAATAAELVRRYGSAMEAVAHAAEIGGKRGAALAKAEEIVSLCLKLVTLRCDVNLGSMLTSTRRTPEAFAAFRKKLEHPDAGKSVTCYGVCSGVPGWRDRETGFPCSLCGGSGKATTYNQRLLDAQQWDQLRGGHNARTV